MSWFKLSITPRYARYYFFFAILLIALPTIFLKYFPSHSGRVLVAAGKMNYSVFERSVIYMTQHHGFGAMGIILNRPLDDKSLSLFKKRFPNIGYFHYGGPVGFGFEFFLMVPNNENRIGFDVLNGGLLEQRDINTFNEIVANPEIAKNVHLFVGYAGWGALQLNREIVNGWWDDIAFDQTFINTKQPEIIWENALKKVLDRKKVKIDAI